MAFSPKRQLESLYLMHSLIILEASIYFVKGNSKKYIGSVSGGVWSGVVPQTGDMVVEIVAKGFKVFSSV